MSSPDTPVDVHVVRSGGVAGMTREWRATATGDDELAAAVSACPWGGDSGSNVSGSDGTGPNGSGSNGSESKSSESKSPGSNSSARDQFFWSISVAGEGARPGTVTLGDSAMTGPWKSLVDIVRSRATGR